MEHRRCFTNQQQSTTKRIVACFGIVSLLFVAIIGLGINPRIRASENILPDRHVHAGTTKLQPKLDANYGKLPLSFEANQGQTDPRVRFLARGSGYAIFLTDDEAVLTLRKSSRGMSRSGKLAVRDRLYAGRPADPHTGLWPSVADGLNSFWQSLITDLSQFVPDPNAGKGTVAGGAESQSPQVVRMKLVGGNAMARVVGLHKLSGRSNYFIGNDPKKWRTNVPSYSTVKYEAVYPGVDLIYYGNQRQLEYDFVVAPGADPSQIKLSFAGADGMRVDTTSGDLVLKVGDDAVRFRKPSVYQPALEGVLDRHQRSQSAATEELSGAFVLASNNEVSFRTAGYDSKRALVIDPVLSYSTFLGGSSPDYGFGIALDSSNSAYVTGWTESSDFPTANPLQTSNHAYYGNAFVSKLNSGGSALVYSTYLGGSGPSGDMGNGIAVDAFGNAYVTGNTSSSDFPVVNQIPGACLMTCGTSGNGDVFVAKLNPTGSALVYSTYLGGNNNDQGQSIAVDSSGNAYVTGQTESTEFPTVNPLQGTNHGLYNAFVAKLNAAGSALVYSTYLGGNAYDYALGIAVDSSGNAYMTGYTSSTQFPTASPFQANNYGSPYNAFVAKLNAAGSALVYSTYLGGTVSDYGYGIAVDSSGNAHVTGYTKSTNFPTVNPLQANNKAYVTGGEGTAFVAEFDSTGSALVYATYLGGSLYDYGTGIAVDSSGNAYVTGYTASTDFPTVNPLQASNKAAAATGDPTAFVAELDSTGSALVYSTYLGGSTYDYAQSIVVDTSGSAYVTGYTASTDFPTVNPLQASNGGRIDAFVAKISFVVILSPTSLTFGPQNIGTTSAPQTETVTNTGTANLTISTVAIGGTNASDFATTADTCAGATVTPSGTCTVNVTFAPSATGSRSASLSFTDSAADSPQTMSLTGVATTPVAGVSPPSLTFGNQNLGTTSSSQPFTLSNTGSGALTITSIATSANFGQTNNCGSSVAASSSCTINVTFSPTTTGTLTGTLTITDDSNGAVDSTQTANLSGTGWAPMVMLSVPGLSFGNQVLSTTSAPETETVTNAGTANLAISTVTIAGSNGSDFSKSVDTCASATLPPNATCTVNVTFTPSATGNRSATLSFTDNNDLVAGSTQTVSLSGTGGVPLVSLSASGLSFGTQAPSTASTPQTETVTNTGTANLTISLVTIAGTNASDFVTTANTCTLATVAPNGTCTVSVTFIPRALGIRSASLNFTDSASSSPQTASLTGTGTAPLAGVTPASLTFTNQGQWTTSAAQPLTLSNTGNAALTITSIIASSNFGQTNNCGSSIAASGSCTINVTFSPTTTGPLTGALYITDNSNEVVGTVQTVSLSGTGTAPSVSLSAPNLSFGNQLTGTTSTAQSETISNTGTGSLIFTGLAATGDFGIAASGTTCSPSAPVAAGGSCVVNVTFTPRANGARSGSLTLTDNANGSPQTASLSGTGTGPVVSLSNPPTFSPQLVGTTSNSQTVILTNTGNINLTFTAIAVSGPFAITTSGTTCSTSSPIADAATCTVAVTFTPTAAGTASGSLSFSDNAPNSPQTVALSGTGQDFSLTAASGSSTSDTVTPGSPATYNFSIGGEGGFSGTVNFTCVGAPSEATCTVSPNPVTAGSSTTNVTVTVNTTAASVDVPRSRPLPPVPPLSLSLRGLLMFAFVLAVMAWTLRCRNKPHVGRSRSATLPLAVGLLLALMMAACGGGGGGGGGSGSTNPGTPAGTYTMTVTGTANSGSSTVNHSMNLTLTVS